MRTQFSHRGAVGPFPRHLVREEMLERLLVVVGLEAREEALEEGVGERDAVGVGDDRHDVGRMLSMNGASKERE